MSIAFRPKRDAALGLMAWAVPLLANFVATPAIVRGLGAQDYGIYILLTGFATYAVTLAVSNALIRFAPLVADNPLAGCRHLLPSALWLAAAGAAVNCTVIISLRHWLLPDAGSDGMLGFALACTLVTVLIFNQVLIVIPQIARRFPWVVLLTMTAGIVLPLGALVVVKQGGTWTGVLLWQLVVALLQLLALSLAAAFLLRHRPARSLDRGWRAKMAMLAATIGLSQMLGNGLAVGERGLLGALAGAEAVGHYVLALMVAQLLRAGIAQATAMFPTMVVQSYGASDRELAELYGWVIKHVTSLATFGALALVICGPALLAAWLGDAYRSEIGLALRWLAPTMALFAVATIPWGLAEARDVASANTVLSGVLLIAVCALALILAPARGAEGLALARFIAMIVVPAYVGWIEWSVLGAAQRRLWLGCLWRLAVAAPACAAVMGLGLSVLPAGWAGLLANLVAGFAAFYGALFATRQITRADLAPPMAPVPRR
jgi:O-antigen/teichoic acid export membrane protein